MPDILYDLVIAGTGPAGLTAALYGQRLGMNTIVFGDIPGGNVYMIEKLENYPGFIGGITGTEFGVKLFQQAQNEGALFTMTRLKKLGHGEGVFQATDVNGQVHAAAAAIIATGRVPIRLPSAKADLKGVNFCSVCDGPLYRNQNAILAVVGSDNSAAQHAMTLARIADKVYLIHRSNRTRMDTAHAVLLAGKKNVEIMDRTEVVGIKGLDLIEALIIRSSDGKDRELPVDGMFMAVGWRPNAALLDLEIAKTPEGYLTTDAELMTTFPGLFAAGDIRDTNMWQVLTACADGARAAKYVSDYLDKKAS
jgi:thioredoxin reductase (NADPH)